MKGRRDTLYLKYLGSRRGDGEASDSAAAERRWPARPRPGPSPSPAQAPRAARSAAQPRGTAGNRLTPAPAGREVLRTARLLMR